MKLLVFNQTGARIPRGKLQRLFSLVTAAEADRTWLGSVNLVFIGDARMRTLNRRFRHKDRSTDVLSFAIDNPDADGTFGEVYVSVPTARRQAAEFGVGITDELVRLTCHGLLHLFGYDHEKPGDSETMMALQERYLERFARG